VNYFLYIVGGVPKTETFNIGDCGVGKTSIGVGIFDAPYGTMYVVPSKYIYERTNTTNPGPRMLKSCILEYYGLK
jgi:hypothetical protein